MVEKIQYANMLSTVFCKLGKKKGAKIEKKNKICETQFTIKIKYE